MSETKKIIIVAVGTLYSFIFAIAYGSFAFWSTNPDTTNLYNEKVCIWEDLETYVETDPENWTREQVENFFTKGMCFYDSYSAVP